MSKYRNVKTVVDGIVFHSKKEATRYGELLLLQRAGEISQLELQPPLKLVVNGVHVCTYVADFAYVKRGESRGTIEDVKGHRTALYMLKKKLVRACHGIEIEET